MEYKIGDRVKTADDNTHGVVTDILVSMKYNCTVYEITPDLACDPDGTFLAEDLELVNEPHDYRFDLEVDDNLVIARMIGSDGDEIACGSAKIFHEGTFGVAQAASYAMRRIYRRLGGDATTSRCKGGRRNG